MLNVHFISQIIMKDNQNHCSPESSPHPDMHELQKYQRKMQASREKQILQKEITKELSVSTDCHPNARRYSYRLISLLLRVFLFQQQLILFYHYSYQYLVKEQCLLTSHNCYLKCINR